MNIASNPPRPFGPPRPIRSVWPQNPEVATHAPHWSANESLVRLHRAIYHGAIRERQNSLVTAALLGITLEELHDTAG